MGITILKDRELKREEKLKRLKKLGYQITKEGDVIGYKTFNSMYRPPKSWVIKKGSIIESPVDYSGSCNQGINLATLEWVEDVYGTKRQHKYINYIEYYKDIWKLLIKNEWLDGVCIPCSDEPKIRCERVQLLEKLTVNCEARVRVRKKLGYPTKTIHLSKNDNGVTNK